MISNKLQTTRSQFMNGSTLQIIYFKHDLSSAQPWDITKLGALDLSRITKGNQLDDIENAGRVANYNTHDGSLRGERGP